MDSEDPEPDIPGRYHLQPSERAQTPEGERAPIPQSSDRGEFVHDLINIDLHIEMAQRARRIVRGDWRNEAGGQELVDVLSSDYASLLGQQVAPAAYRRRQIEDLLHITPAPTPDPVVSVAPSVPSGPTDTEILDWLESCAGAILPARGGYRAAVISLLRVKSESEEYFFSDDTIRQAVIRAMEAESHHASPNPKI